MMNAPANGGVFAGAQPKDTPAEPTTDPEPAPEPDPNLTPAPPPITSLTVTESGLLEFVLQQAYMGVEGEEAERIRAVLAPQYAILAQYLQGAFNGATQVDLPADWVAAPEPEPAAAADSGASVTRAMAVVAVTTLLNDTAAPGASAAVKPAGVPAADPVLIPLTAATSSLELLVVDTQGFSTSVPEPSSMLLLASAGLALAWARKRSA